MISNKDMEKLWLRYQREGIARNLSLQSFCSLNNVPFNSFEKYLKTRREMSDVYEVRVTDMPEESSATPAINDTATAKEPAVVSDQLNTTPEHESRTRILVTIKINNGISITQGNLDYHGLRRLVEKLEVLC